MAKSIKISTGKVRLSYANVWEPKPDQSGREKFSVSLIIPKGSATEAKIKQAIKALREDPEAKQVWGGKTAGIRIPLRDGDVDREGDPAYENMMFLNANSPASHPPRIVDKNKNEILDHSEVYSGCYAQAVITLFAYNSNGNKGIGVGLGGIRKLSDGEPLTSALVTDTDFEDLGDDEEDEDDIFGD